MGLFDKFEGNRIFSVFFAAVVLFGIYLAIAKPLLPEVDILKTTFWRFGLSLQATVLLCWIGIYLLYRWNLGERKNAPQLIWGVSFLLYAIVFVGMLLQSFGLAFADANKPEIFFAFRQFMIIWAAGMYYGLSTIAVDKKNWLLRQGLSVLLLVAGYVIFFWGLFVRKDIEQTMYLFLHFLFIPLCLVLHRLFWNYSKMAGISSAKYISFGFLAVAATYLAWAPWHKTSFYAVWFFLFNLSLVPLLVGFLLVPREG